MDFVNGADGWAVAGMGCGYALGNTSAGPPCAILATTDGGASWQPVLETSDALDGLDFSGPLHGLAWGPDAVFSTADGGRNWVRGGTMGGAVPASLDLVSAAEVWGVAAGAVVRSGDAGASWSAAYRTTACAFSSVSFAGTQDGWAAGTSAGGVCLYATDDGGAAWTPVFARLSSGPAAAAFGTYLKTYENDVGAPAAWEAGGAGGVCVTVRVDRLSAAAGWLAASWCGLHTGALTVLRASDGGAAWAYGWGTDGCLMGCEAMGEGAWPASFLNGATAWIWAPFGVAQTTDAGAAWSRPIACVRACVPPGPSGAGAICARAQCGNGVSFINGEEGWAASPEGIFATADGGRTWRLQWP